MVSGLAVSVVLAALAVPVEAPPAVEAQASVAPVRVYVGGVDTSRFEQLFHPALEAGPFSSGSQLTSVGRTVVAVSASDVNLFESEARRLFADSAAFELVSSLEEADYVMVVEADYISADARRRLRGVLKLVDVTDGADAYRRRVDFASISTRSILNRELNTTMNLMEEWAADAVR